MLFHTDPGITCSVWTTYVNSLNFDIYTYIYTHSLSVAQYDPLPKGHPLVVWNESSAQLDLGTGHK